MPKHAAARNKAAVKAKEANIKAGGSKPKKKAPKRHKAGKNTESQLDKVEGFK